MLKKWASSIWIVTLLWVVCVFGIIYDVWVIYAGHIDQISLYGPACGLFAEMVRRLDRLSPSEREALLQVAHDQSAFADEAIKRRAERYTL